MLWRKLGPIAAQQPPQLLNGGYAARGAILSLWRTNASLLAAALALTVRLCKRHACCL